MKRVFLLLVLLICCNKAMAVTITAVAGGGNWTNSASWSPAQTPTNGDAVVLANTSGNVTVDGPATFGTLGASTYTNVLNLSSGNTLIGGGNVTFGSGMAITGTGTLTFQDVVTTTITSAGVTVSGTTILPRGTYSATDSFNVTNLIIGGPNSGTSNLSALKNLNIAGNLSCVFGSVDNTGMTVSMVGSGSVSMPNFALSASNFFINTSGSITLGTNVRLDCPLIKYISGTIVNTGSVLTTSGQDNIDTNTMHWGTIQSNQASQTLLSNFVCDGAVSIAPAANGNVLFAGGKNITCGTLYIAGGKTFKMDAGSTITASNIRWEGNGSLTTTGMASTSGTIYLNYQGTASNNQNWGCAVSNVDATPSNQTVNLYDPLNITSSTHFLGVTLPMTGGGGYFF